MNTEAEYMIWGISAWWWVIMAFAVIAVFIFGKIRRKLK